MPLQTCLKFKVEMSYTKVTITHNVITECSYGYLLFLVFPILFLTYINRMKYAFII